MATAKKTKAPVAAKAKKAVKKPTTVKRTTKKQVNKPVAAKQDFFEVRFSDESVYWLIFGVVAIVFSLWIYSLDSKVRDLYDQVDANSYNMGSSAHDKITPAPAPTPTNE